MYSKSFGKYISVILRHQRIILNHAFHQLGFSTGTYSIFLSVAENEGSTQKELSQKIITTKSTVNKALKKLEESGFVETIIDTGDRRLHRVYLTQKGKDISPKVYEILKNYSIDLSAVLTPEEEDVTFNALVKMANRVKEMADNIREAHIEQEG